jgi:hypothetical protein
MKNTEKCLLVAGELRERAKLHGPLSRRARMLILAERLEAVAGAPEKCGEASDPVQLALGAYARLMTETATGAPNRI